MGSRSMGLRRREWLVVLAWLATLSGSVSDENGSKLAIPYTNDELCDSVSYMKVNTSHVGPENPKLLTEVINFTVLTTWTRTGVFGMKIFADEKLIETRLIEMNATKSKKCEDEVKHVFNVVNYGPSDPEIQGHPQLDVLLYVLPSRELENNFSCHNSSLCVRTEIFYHFAPLPKNVKFNSYPTTPTVGKFLNLTCNTKDGSPPVDAYSMHMYDYYNGGELFGTLLKSVVFNSAKAGKYRCGAINYPFGYREEVYSRIITIKPEVKTSPPPITTTTKPTKAGSKKAPLADLNVEQLLAGKNATSQPQTKEGSPRVTKAGGVGHRNETEPPKNVTESTQKTVARSKSLATRDRPWNQMILFLLSVQCLACTDLLTKL